ncbi:serine hydrolase [Homoserinibacter sp. YIM 151385]|uniref:serine hydrolase n=1 Tax=Homoserinibacter sp. YIM 151385 TaxID=2985506 RepID=UPI0022F0BB5E|nr:serine hydrolase [Homoserinibacter sp. YIM 151385]WBU37187.1 class A beta-lactamase-related serine hydrolase [Homoserinibacter sp. YIM 151385]
MVDTSLAHGRRERLRSRRTPRHRAPNPVSNFAGSFASLGELAMEGAHVSASVSDLDTGQPLVAIDERIVLPTASVGKVLLLIEVSTRLTQRDFAGYGILDKAPAEQVGDSGIWKHLQAPSLPFADLAALVGSTSDNLATNALLRQVGLGAVRARTESLGLTRTALLDYVRDHRGPDDAPQLSVGSAAELAWLFAALARGEVVDSMTSSRVLSWLSLNADLSMVAGAFGLDPLSHRSTDHGILLVNKTGTDAGVRAEAGVVRGPRAAVAYAVTVQFNDSGLPARLRVLDALRTIGTDLLEYVH